MCDKKKKKNHLFTFFIFARYETQISKQSNTEQIQRICL